MEFFTGIMQRITEMNGVLNEMQGDLAKTTEVEDRRDVWLPAAHGRLQSIPGDSKWLEVT